MSWAEYTKSNLDLSEDGEIINSRPYRQGRHSVDDSKIMVRFVNDETPWDNADATYTDKADAREAANSPVYVAPPTPEEIAAEEEADKMNRQEKLVQLVEQARAKYAEGLLLQDLTLDALMTEVKAVADGGESATVTDIATRMGVTEEQVVTGYTKEFEDLVSVCLSSEAMFRQCERAIKQGDVETQQTIRAELLAL